MQRSCLAVVLAAGSGTRMMSITPKVLHKIAGLEMVCHVVDVLRRADCDKIALVVGAQGEKIRECVLSFNPQLEIFTQNQPMGTAHAALAARAALEKSRGGDVLIVFGDTPLLSVESLKRLRMALAEGTDLVVVGFTAQNPTGYGRLIEEDGELLAIVEEKDATRTEQTIQFCNGGVMAMNGAHALQLLEKVGNHNAAGEYYLPDIVAIARAQNLRIRAIEIDGDEILGVNSREQLAAVEELWQIRKRKTVMAQGVSLIAPHSVYFAYDTEISADVVIEPNVFFGPGVKIGPSAQIRAFSHIEGAEIGPHAEIGPFARLRSGTKLQERVKVGNFCETKQTNVGKDTKINHLSYIGNGDIGANVNIGAGTITCNYDGVNKWSTKIGDGAFIGSNSALVAPVNIGDGAYIASGSAIVEDVAPQALAFGRARQVNKPERAHILRKKIHAIKEKK